MGTSGSSWIRVGILLSLVLAVLGGATAYGEVVHFPCENLEAAVRDALGIPEGPITVAHMETLTGLFDASNRGIEQLDGLQHAINIETAWLWMNQISDISPLADLDNLTHLYLGWNQIIDLPPLAGMTSLQLLWVHGNAISDISPLADLTNITDLRLSYNQIIDISLLADLTNLTHLRLDSNQIIVLGPLAGLTNLEYLDLRENEISDISALVENSDAGGLGEDNEVDLRDNYLDLTPISQAWQDIQTLQERGVIVRYEDQFDPVVDIPDPALEAAVREALNKPSGDITRTDMWKLTNLSHTGPKRIELLDGLEYAFYLKHLSLVRYGHEIKNSDLEPLDLEPLEGLINLEYLELWNNVISDLSPLAGLPSLEHLDLRSNQIIDLGGLEGMINLEWLDLARNEISDLGPLAGLLNLWLLVLDHNLIIDISPLAGLTNVDGIILTGNQIIDISPLAGLTNLWFLELGNNEISDLGPLAGLTNLSWLELQGNEISDISALVANSDSGGLGDDDYLNLRYNYLALSHDSDAMQDIQTLLGRGVRVLYEPQREPPPDEFQVRRETGDVLTPGAFHGQEFVTVNGDLAEWVSVTEPVAPGHVLEIDPTGVNQYRLAQGPCTGSVAGVVSTQPGMVLGHTPDTEGQALLALLGVVPVKVTDEGGPIATGDLLIVSSTPGYAMRWDPDSGMCGLVGKALEPHEEGEGVIEVLLTR